MSSIIFVSPFAAAGPKSASALPSSSSTASSSSIATTTATAASTGSGSTDDVSPSVASSPLIAPARRMSSDRGNRLSFNLPSSTSSIDASGMKRVRRMGSALDAVGSIKRGSLGVLSGIGVIGGECGMDEDARHQTSDSSDKTSNDHLATHLSTVVSHSITLSVNYPTPAPLSADEEPPSPRSMAVNQFSRGPIDSLTPILTAPIPRYSPTDTSSGRQEVDRFALDVAAHTSVRPRTSVSSLGSDASDTSLQTSPSSDAGSGLFSYTGGVSESDDGTDPEPWSLPKVGPSGTAGVEGETPSDDSDHTVHASDPDNDEPTLRALLSTWAFDANALSAATIRICPRILLTTYLVRTPGLVAQLRTMGLVDPLASLESLCASLEGAYHDRNAYHNFRHAVDVVQAVYCMLVAEGAAPPLLRDQARPRAAWKRTETGELGQVLTALDGFALLLACAGHDVGHPGLSNAYLVNAGSPLTKVFGSKAVLENFHTITFLRMLRNHGFGPLLDNRPSNAFRSVLTGGILATDMGQHFDVVGKLKALLDRWQAHPELRARASMEDKVLLAIGLIKCGDISNPTRPHHIAKTWSTCLLDEWTTQAALERDLHLPVSVVVLDPAEQLAQAKSQIGFIDLFVQPLFESMEALSSRMTPFAQACRDGRDSWQHVVDTLAAEPPSPVAAPSKPPITPLTLAKRRAHRQGSAGSSQGPGSRGSTSSLTSVDELATPRPTQQERWGNPADALGVPPTGSRAGGPKDTSVPKTAPPPTNLAINAPVVFTPLLAPRSTSFFAMRIPLPHRGSSGSVGGSLYSPVLASPLYGRGSICVTPSAYPAGRPPLNKLSSAEDSRRPPPSKGCGEPCSGTTAKCGACAADDLERERAQAADQVAANESWAASKARSLAWPPHPFRPV